MAAESKIARPEPKAAFGVLRPCTKSDCPLNEIGIHHPEGIYKHEGKDVEFSIIWWMSNPPPFIREALSRFWAAEDAKSAAKAAGDDTKEIEKTIVKNASMVARFLNYHAGCKCMNSRYQHHRYGH